MSASGPKRTSLVAPHMSAFGGKADIGSSRRILASARIPRFRGPIRWSRRGGRQHSRARQDDPDFGELAGLGVHFDRAAVLLDHDVVTDGEPKTGAFSSWFRGEERVEHFFFDFRRNAAAVVANCYLDTIAQVLG